MTTSTQPPASKSDAEIGVQSVAACLDYIKSLDESRERLRSVLREVLATILAKENADHVPAKLKEFGEFWANRANMSELITENRP